MKRGEITAFLSLIFLLMISFTGALIESASIQVLKNQKKADMSLAMENVFAEYQREMLEEYDIFVLDASYGTGISSDENIMRRLAYYGADGMENKVEHVELLTDSGGLPFYEQAVRYMENKLGFDYFEGKEKEEMIWKEQENDKKEYQDEETDTHTELDTILEDAGENLPEENNPIQSVENLKKLSLLQLTVPHPEQLSNKKIEQRNLASFRERKKGTGNLSGDDGKVLFHAYLLEHFSNMTNAQEEDALAYELEYLLGGKPSDQENLEIVAKKLVSLRFAANYGYLLTDETKKAEAEVMALTLCSLLTVPGITEVAKHAILLAWAYGESIMDLRVLFGGRRVPLVKNRENWQLQLSDLLTLGNEETWKDGGGVEDGMSYEDYLKGLMILEKREHLSMRALDLIELDLKQKADDCVTKLEVKSNCSLRRGIHYEFLTYFGYE